MELAKAWRTERSLRQLEALLIVADAETSLVISVNGDVIEPEDNMIAIGSGGPFAQSAARALMDNTDRILINQLFDVLIRDFAVYAAGLYGKPSNSQQQRELIRALLEAPATDPEQAEKFYREKICTLNNVYRLAD